MRLADFIGRNMEPILAEWEVFASTLFSVEANPTRAELRDHAREMLEAIARDLRVPQTREAQTAKSKGLAPQLMDAPETAAHTHATMRARSGFDINQLVSEYRALRASVLRLWMDDPVFGYSDLQDFIRFNEAVDQAIAESISFFSAHVEKARNLLLGMLGHDMRTPLNTITMTATFLSRLNAGVPVSEAASRLIRSGARMQSLLDDLVEFNRTSLGVGIVITPTELDLADLFTDELDQLRAAYPERLIELHMAGDTHGYWDGPRLQRLLGNLIVNAFKYGAPETGVQVQIFGDERHHIRFEVRNAASAALDSGTLQQIFQPLNRGPRDDPRRESDGGLGLGLFIAREIARAHGGDIEGRSDVSVPGKPITVFTVLLLRHPQDS